MIKVKYNQQTTLVEGYFPSFLNYPNNIIDTEAKTIDGSPYIEITEEQHQASFGKEMCVIDGTFQEYVTPDNVLLEQSKKERKNQLKSNCQAFQYSNFVFEENIYKASESAQNKLANKIQTVSQSGNALFSWNDAFDEVIALELSEAQELLAAIIAREDFAYSNYAEKLKEIEACTTLEELNNININFN